MRRRLFLVTLAVTTLLVAAFAIPLAVLVRDVARDRAVTEAEQDIAAVGQVLAVRPDRALLDAAIRLRPSGADGRFSVLLPDGTQLGDPTPLPDDAVALARDRRLAFSQTAGSGLDVYGPVVLGEEEVVVLRVRVPGSTVREGVGTAWLVLAVVALVLVTVAVLATDRLARSVTRPAVDLARTSRTLAAGDTSARASVAGPPEIVEVAEALNLLAERIEELLAAERERVADLSHRLRTPLTALRLDAEGLGADALVADVDRLEAEVSELIREARRPLRDLPALRSDVGAVVTDRATFWGALADDDARTWSCEVADGGPHLVQLGDEEVAAAIDVLVGNVFAHTPEGTPYRLEVSAEDGAVCLAVEDGGPGIEQPSSVLDRGRSGARSTGLGLDIAASTARAAGGELAIERGPHLGGARVVLRMPRVDERR